MIIIDLAALLQQAYNHGKERQNYIVSTLGLFVCAHPVSVSVQRAY